MMSASVAAVRDAADVISALTAGAAIAGVVPQWAGTRLVQRFVRQAASPPHSLPPVSVMKPLCGAEPLTELALESFFLLDYPEFQLVFGVQDAADPVLAILDRLRVRYPAQEVVVVVDDSAHGSNRKVSNLINMLPVVKYDALVISDADTHVPPGFLRDVISALEQPGVGLVTTLYTGLPGIANLPSLLGAAHINYSFLPGALLGRLLGRQDCLGVTMALSREMLTRVGGFQALANHLADDQVLGRLVRAKGGSLALAQVIPATTVAEADFRELFIHELRWARTIRALVPGAYLASILQTPLFWALLCIIFSGGFWGAWLLFLALLILRRRLAQRLNAVLRLPDIGGAWLFVLRDLLSVAVYVLAFCGNDVRWRGQVMQADSGKQPSKPRVSRSAIDSHGKISRMNTTP